MTAFDYEVDVAVVGGGACGLMAALRAARDPDLVVAVYEKSTKEGCNTRFSSGSLAAGGTRFQRAAGIDDSPERHAADILRVSGDPESEPIVKALCRVAPRYVEWLADELGPQHGLTYKATWWHERLQEAKRRLKDQGRHLPDDSTQAATATLVANGSRPARA